MLGIKKNTRQKKKKKNGRNLGWSKGSYKNQVLGSTTGII